MRWARLLRARRHRSAFSKLAELYSQPLGSDAVLQHQLALFNDLWQAISRHSRFYVQLKKSLALPDRFASWEEFFQLVPLLSRSDLKQNLDEISFQDGKPDYWRITGGSSAEPIGLPAWRSEDEVTSRNTWLARNWFDVDASDRLFLLWGHSHLLGDGVTGHLNAAARRVKDRILGYRRFSAYDLSEKKMKAAGRELLRFEPEYVLGYSGALHRLAVMNEDLRPQFHALGLKVAIATGESFPSPESSRLISNVLGCPVAMEYGAVETGTIAHQYPNGDFRVFWDSYFIERLPSSDTCEFGEIAVTALYPRLTPLIRYRLGDLIANSSDDPGSNRSIDKIIGRSNDCIHLEQSGVVHSESFSHVLRDIPGLDAFQVIQRANHEITIAYVSNSRLPGHTVELLRDRLRTIHPRLHDTTFQKVAAIPGTIAGKSKRIVSEIEFKST